jgi:hypothetical protein
MLPCHKCGSELDPYDQFGNPYATCSKGCESESKDPMSPEERLQDDKDSLNNDLHIDFTKTSHCWTPGPGGFLCPGVVLRTPQTADPPYGHFCPECGSSLRYHPHYGKGKSGDLALRIIRTNL